MERENESSRLVKGEDEMTYWLTDWKHNRLGNSQFLQTNDKGRPQEMNVGGGGSVGYMYTATHVNCHRTETLPH